MRNRTKVIVVLMLAVFALCFLAWIELANAFQYTGGSAMYSLEHPANILCGVKSLGFFEYNAPQCVKVLQRIGYYSGWISVGIWASFAIWGMIKLRDKGRFPTSGCLVGSILLGWWTIPLLLALGPLLLLTAYLIRPKSRCPHCREWIAQDATRCPKCQGVLNASQTPMAEQE